MYNAPIQNSFFFSIIKNHINILFFLFITVVFIINVTLYDFYINKPIVDPGHSVLVLLCSGFLVIGLLNLRKQLRIFEKPAVFFGCYFFLAILSIVFFTHTLSWDIEYTLDAVVLFQKSGTFPEYLIHHYNNLAYFGILNILASVIPIKHGFFTIFLTLLNALCITTCLTIIGRILLKHNKTWGKNFYFVSFLFVPLLIYVTIPYTDTFSLIFLALFLLLFPNDPKTGNEYLRFFVSLLFLAIGALMKASLVIVIIALCIILLFVLSAKKNLFRNMFLMLIPLVLFSCLSWAFQNIFVYEYMKGDKEYLENNKYPVEHYIFMGQNEKTFGTFFDDDNNYTWKYIETHPSDPKTLTNNLQQMTKERIANRDGFEQLQFFIYKFSKVWAQPDFYAFKEGKDCRFERVLKDIQCDVKTSNWYNNFYFLLDILYTTILLIVFLGALVTIKQKDEPVLLLLCKLSLLGVCCFLLIWEARSRYLISFMPFMLILAAYFLTYLQSSEKIQTLLGKHHV